MFNTVSQCLSLGFGKGSLPHSDGAPLAVAVSVFDTAGGLFSLKHEALRKVLD